MKQLTDYIYEYNSNILKSAIYEGINSNCTTLQESYENIFDMMFSVNEGFFTNIGKKLTDWGSKAAKTGENIDKRITNASDAAKRAINTAKVKAGNAWKKVKDSYTSVILAVDDAIKASKDSIADLCKQAKIKIEDFEAKCALIYANAMSKSQEIADNIGKWVSDSTKGAQRFAALNTLLMGAMLARKTGIDSSMALEILSAAGFK